VTRRLEDLDAASQAWVRETAAAAPPMTEAQRQRLQLLFRGAGSAAKEASE
jgi:hypothetical protein